METDMIYPRNVPSRLLSPSPSSSRPPPVWQTLAGKWPAQHVFVQVLFKDEHSSGKEGKGGTASRVFSFCTVDPVSQSTPAF